MLSNILLLCVNDFWFVDSCLSSFGCIHHVWVAASVCVLSPYLCITLFFSSSWKKYTCPYRWNTNVKLREIQLFYWEKYSWWKENSYCCLFSISCLSTPGSERCPLSALVTVFPSLFRKKYICPYGRNTVDKLEEIQLCSSRPGSVCCPPSALLSSPNLALSSVLCQCLLYHIG